ncbi:MAG: MogA/MoaB family molybdenum cofactor biosynthesis protein [Bacteroidetes bacterium]|nr:MAG: MogA/MoaB family molybdenum cofactor biosynthesis protein [Bacteroidota bacterium]
MTPSKSTDQHRSSADTISADCAIITCSDTRTELTDTSGKQIRTQLEDSGHQVIRYQIVPDDIDLVRSLVEKLVADQVDVILLNGGTGIARRDVTYDVIESMLHKTLPGFGEIFRMLSYEEVGAAAMLSRAIAGTIDGTLIFSMPGSSNAVRLAMSRLIVPELKHLVWELRR